MSNLLYVLVTQTQFLDFRICNRKFFKKILSFVLISQFYGANKDLLFEFLDLELVWRILSSFFLHLFENKVYEE